MARSLAAVLAGLCVTFLLVIVLDFLAGMAVGVHPGEPPTRAYLTLNLLGGALAGLSGGAAAARIAAHRPHGHVGALAGVILLLSLPTLFSAPAPGQPQWYALVLSVLGPLSVMVGGYLAAPGRGRPT
jgi:hypothetical protein